MIGRLLRYTIKEFFVISRSQQCYREVRGCEEFVLAMRILLEILAQSFSSSIFLVPREFEPAESIFYSNNMCLCLLTPLMNSVYLQYLCRMRCVSIIKARQDLLLRTPSRIALPSHPHNAPRMPDIHQQQRKEHRNCIEDIHKNSWWLM